MHRKTNILKMTGKISATKTSTFFCFAIHSYWQWLICSWWNEKKLKQIQTNTGQ